MKHIKQYEDLTQRFKIGDLVKIINIDEFIKTTSIPSINYDLAYDYFQNNIGKIVNPYTNIIDVEFPNTSKIISFWADKYNSATVAYEVKYSNIRLATDFEIDSKKYNL